MNRGLLHKVLREILPTTLLIGAALFLVEIILAYVLPRFQQQFSQQMAAMPFFQTVMKALLGTDVSAGIGPEVLLSLAWVHPVVLALLWTHAILAGTRVPAGEVDRGTIDILLGLPVSRWQVLTAETLVAAGGAVLIVGAAVAGHLLGASGAPAEHRIAAARLPAIGANLVALHLAVAGVSSLVSSFCDRRGRAAAVAVAVVLASFLLNYLAQFWEPARRVAFLGVLDYVRPVTIIRTGQWPLRDLAVLVGVGAACWTVGGVVFARRDLCTV